MELVLLSRDCENDGPLEIFMTRQSSEVGEKTSTGGGKKLLLKVVKNFSIWSFVIHPEDLQTLHVSSNENIQHFYEVTFPHLTHLVKKSGSFVEKLIHWMWKSYFWYK